MNNNTDTRGDAGYGRGVTGGCYDRGSTFLLKWFLNDGVPQPKIVGKTPLFLHDLVVYLGLFFFFHPVAFLVSSKPTKIGGAFLNSQTEEPQKTKVVHLCHLYRSPRLVF